MKNKKRLFFIVILAALGGLFLVAKVTGALQNFRIPTASGIPAMQVGDHIWVSNLVSPGRYDFIVFNYYDSMMGQKHHRVYRLCGIPGDTVEIRNGDLLVNNQNTSGLFDLCLEYTIAIKDARIVNETLKLPEDDLYFLEDKAEVFLTSEHIEQLKKLNIAFERKIFPKEEMDKMISTMYGQPWNNDHFGPLVIPPDRYFVLGDNRHRSQDSRYIGLVPKSDFYGTVISK